MLLSGHVAIGLYLADKSPARTGVRGATLRRGSRVYTVAGLDGNRAEWKDVGGGLRVEAPESARGQTALQRR